MKIFIKSKQLITDATSRRFPGIVVVEGQLIREAKYWAALGVSVRDTLLAVTKNCAELLGLADRIGMLEPGKFADVISLHGDPYQEITALRNVGLVMKAGQQYEHLV